MTPEETKWRASVYAPEKIRRKLKLQYWLCLLYTSDAADD